MTRTTNHLICPRCAKPAFHGLVRIKSGRFSCGACLRRAWQPIVAAIDALKAVRP